MYLIPALGRQVDWSSRSTWSRKQVSEESGVLHKKSRLEKKIFFNYKNLRIYGHLSAGPEVGAYGTGVTGRCWA